MDAEIREVQVRIEKESKLLSPLKAEIGKVIVGQEDMVNKILIGLISNGHILIEGVPGLAKSLTVSTVAQGLNADLSEFNLLQTCSLPISLEQ